jgi:protein involved in polysaccharide export with SLBB domain
MTFTASANAELAKADSTLYLLSPFDQVSISVYGQPDLSSRQRISDRGAISVPLVGDISVGGRSVFQAQKLIEHTFVEQCYLVKPIVTISIDEFSPKVVTVLGEVERPGSIEIPPGRNNLAIQIVIAEAGGFTGAAHKTEVHVSREDNQNSSTNKKTIEVDVSAMLESSGKGLRSNVFFVQPDDIVFVPRRLF